MRRGVAIGLFGLTALGALSVAAGLREVARLGKQNDGSFIVSSGQHIPAGTIAFDGRPIDLAVHPSGKFFAVLNKGEVFLADRSGVVPGSTVTLGRKINA